MSPDNRDEPHLRMSDEAAPIVFTYRRVSRPPVIERRKRFVGVRAAIRNAVSLLKETVEHLVYVDDHKVIDAGESTAVHWAIQVEDPFDASSPSPVIAVQTHGYRPPAGFHFEVISNVHAQREAAE